MYGQKNIKNLEANFVTDNFAVKLGGGGVNNWKQLNLTERPEFFCGVLKVISSYSHPQTST
jgi:hypothetical protein